MKRMMEVVEDDSGYASNRTEILLAAAELFMDLGFSATSIDAIAERLGSTKGRVYHHFRSKAEIYFEIQRLAMRMLFDKVGPIARSDTAPREKLERMVRAHADCLLHALPVQKVAVPGMELHLFAATAARHTKDVRQIIHQRDDYETLFAEVIDAGIRSRVFVDQPPRMLTKAVFGTVNWVTIWYRPRKLQTEADLDAVASVLTEFAMRGILRHAGETQNDKSAIQ